MWTEEKTVRLEMAVSVRGHNWTAIAADPRFGLTNIDPDALRMKYNSMAEKEEWIDSPQSTEEETDYFDVESYINGPVDRDELSDDANWLPPVPLETSVSEEQECLEWWDHGSDPDYTSNFTQLPSVVEGKYSLRRREDNPPKTAVYVAPPSIVELRKPQIPMKWNDDYYKEFARAMSIYGHNWSKMTTDSTIGLPSNLKGPNLKEKWKSMDIDNTMLWLSSDDSDSDFDEFCGEDNNGYVHYLLNPSQFLHEFDEFEQTQNPIQPAAPDLQYKWGTTNFEVGSSSNPPRKNPPRKISKCPSSISIPHPRPTANPLPAANPPPAALFPHVPKGRRTPRVLVRSPSPPSPEEP